MLPQVLERTRQLFDLYCDPDEVAGVLSPMNEIKPGIFVPGIRVPGCFDVFEMSVRPDGRILFPLRFSGLKSTGTPQQKRDPGTERHLASP